MGAIELPPRFPCWCQATYSWGGETKKDLGFIEGDLIEALNAGDGSWWTGRLRRDPRAIGIFPSNFVKVLDEGFQPAPNSRNASPLTAQNKSSTTPTSSKSVFRKPFQAYEKLGPRGSLDSSREGTPESDKEKPKKKSKFTPYSSMKTAQPPMSSLRKHGSTSPLKNDSFPRIPDPLPRGSFRASAPASPLERAGSAASPNPAPMHAPSQPQRREYRRISPQPHYDTQPAPPAPSRPHSPLPATYHDGSAYPQILPASRQPSPNPYQHEHRDFQHRAQSPAPSFDYSRDNSPTPYDDDGGSSPPPPPPPAHRVVYQPSRAPSPQPYYSTRDDHTDQRGSATPVPPSPGEGHNMTPSPLRDAMNDVMSSLHDMSMDADASEHEDSRSPANTSASNIWSPDEFELVRNQSRREHAHSALGFTGRNRHLEESRVSSMISLRDGEPQLEDYVQRMERDLGHNQFDDAYASDDPPQPPLKGAQYTPYRPTTADSQSSQEHSIRPELGHQRSNANLHYRKSNIELSRTYTTKTNVTNSTNSSSATHSSNSTQLTSRSIMSGHSAGGFSATSAGSLARHKYGLGSQRGHSRTMSAIDLRETGGLGDSGTRSTLASESSGSGPSYHGSHASEHIPTTAPSADWAKDPVESGGILGGLSAPKARRSGFFRKMIDSAKTTARTGAASARSTIGSASGSRPGSRAGSPTKNLFGGIASGALISGNLSRPGSAHDTSPSKDIGASSGVDWMQVRRDINRSNTISRREREDRLDRCEMMEKPALNPIDLLHELAEGDEGLDGLPITEPTDFNTSNLSLVDKSTRFIQSIPAMVPPSTLAQSYICRPHRTDVQRLRAIFIWVAERITWEEDFEGQIDAKRVLQTRRGCSEEIAVLVRNMCHAVGLHAEVVRGYLKAPGESLDLDTIARPNHFWNAVIVDGEWRLLDCSLANPSNPRRSAYSSASSQIAESWYFLARPLEICYTHIPLLPEQQHIVPPVDHEILLALPCACPSYFRNTIELAEFNTSMLHLENLEMAHIFVNVPEDVECIAETEARAYACDVDGDLFESGEMIKKPSLTQAEWINGRKRYRVKALLPGDEGTGTLKIYAGKRGLMHSAKDNPHALAFALPISHVGQNPPYTFLTRHPTPHAQRHDLYVAQPQCSKLVLNNTFVFSVRQHPSFLSRFTPDTWGASIAGNSGSAGPGRPASPNPYARPTSAMSMRSMTSATTSQTGSNYSDPPASGQAMTAAQQKPAKLAIQTPSQKIIRLTRKQEHSSRPEEHDGGLTTSWETVVKIGEKGTWRGLVLADRSARWCVFAEWECV